MRAGEPNRLEPLKTAVLACRRPRVHNRRMLAAVDQDVWMADGPVVSFFGFPYPTRMVVVRLSGGDLWVWSPIGLNEQLREQVEACGPVRHLVAPNKIHHLFLDQWKRAWPEARLYAAPGLASRRPDLALDTELGGEPDPAWRGEIDQVLLGGSLVMNEVVFFHRASRSCLVCDLVQRHDPAGMPRWKAAIMRLDGLVGDHGSTPREWRLSFFDRRKARAARERILAWNSRRVVIAHGRCIDDDVAGTLSQALAWLG